jgi:lipopolysaccharide biosynthesis protein
MPRFGRKRVKPSAITLADRARDTGQWEVAAEYYRGALQRKPENPPIWVQYGHVLKEAGHLAEAEKAYRTALVHDRRVADSHLQLGHVLKLLGKEEEARAAYLRALALDRRLNSASFELAGLGWSSAHFAELRAVFGSDVTDPPVLTTVNGTSPELSVIPSPSERPDDQKQDNFAPHRSPENPTTAMGERSGHIGSCSSAPAESDAELILQSGLFDKAWYIEKYRDARGVALNPIVHYLRCGAEAGLDPHPLFDSDWYIATNPDVAKRGQNPLVHFVCSGAAEGRAPHPLFDTAWYLKTNSDVVESGINPLTHYLSFGALEGRAPHPLLKTNSYLARNLPYVLSGALYGDKVTHPGPASPNAGPAVHVPDLFELRGLKPRGHIAVVLHLYYPDLWDEMRQAIERISHPFDLFVSLVKGTSELLRSSVMQAFPNAYIFDFENRGRDIGPFLVFLQSGVLFQYELVCKLHTKRSPHRNDAGAWRRWLIHSVAGSSQRIDQIVSSFRSDPDIGMVVADGNIYRGHEHWALNEKLLAELLPRIGISPDVKDRSFPGGSIFWIRPLLLRTLVGAGMELRDFEPEPVEMDGSLAHAVERMFGLICEDAGMRVAESGRLGETVRPPPSVASNVHIIAYYLPQFHPIPENDSWWGAGFTEWTNVTRAQPLFEGHRQPRLPADLGFYDLRLQEVRDAQAELARRYGLAAFCYYYYWFNGRRVLQRPLDEVLASGQPDFPFLICWANEPWTRNWDGLGRDVLLPQTYDTNWATRFAEDIAPLLRDKRYFCLDRRPMLLIYRIGNIPEAGDAMRQLRAALSQRGLPEVHLAAAWVWFPEDDELPADPSALGLDAYFEFPPHMLLSQPARPLPSGLTDKFEGDVYDYDRTVTTTLATLDEKLAGRRHRCVMVGWDNTARTGERAHIFHGATPANFRRWLRGTVAHERRQAGERVVFINAWNEWAEGTYLEPDREFGRGWLEAVASATQPG